MRQRAAIQERGIPRILKALGLHMEFIAASTPEQKTYIESFHGK
ncbi:MAG TPA: hypothetical protein VNI77_01050 [Nitrososphaera sp.]|nr:hypothetical protein [Nitrososphaera sp.]